MSALSLSILNNLKLVCRGFLERSLVRLCQRGSVSPVHRTGLVESYMDFTIPLGFPVSLASFLPWGRSVSNTGKLGYKVVDSCVDLG
jgi:hypothetical protein